MKKYRYFISYFFMDTETQVSNCANFIDEYDRLIETNEQLEEIEEDIKKDISFNSVSILNFKLLETIDSPQDNDSVLFNSYFAFDPKIQSLPDVAQLAYFKILLLSTKSNISELSENEIETYLQYNRPIESYERSLSEIKSWLKGKGLIDENWQPINSRKFIKPSIKSESIFTEQDVVKLIKTLDSWAIEDFDDDSDSMIIARARDFIESYEQAVEA